MKKYRVILPYIITRERNRPKIIGFGETVFFPDIAACYLLKIKAISPVEEAVLEAYETRTKKCSSYPY